MVATTETPFALATDKAALAAVGDGREHWPVAYVSEGNELAQLLAGDWGDAIHEVEEIPCSRLMQGPVSLTTSFMFDRTAAISAGGCAAQVRALDDHVLYLNLTRITGPALRLRHPMLYYRVHPASASVTSPLVAPYLSTLLAVRWGRVFPPEPIDSEYIAHLLSLLQRSGLTPAQQLALLLLTSAPNRRRAYFKRWAGTIARGLINRSGAPWASVPLPERSINGQDRSAPDRNE
jgi:hypothetical protein